MWQWLSFCDVKRPIGEQFLGAAIVPAEDIVTGVIVAHQLGINPGGQVAGITIPEETVSTIPESYRSRLLTKPECQALNTITRPS